MCVLSGTSEQLSRSEQVGQVANAWNSSKQECVSEATSFSQSSSSQQSREVYEATEVVGATRGYQVKGQDETGRRSQSAAARESGLFGGIGGDDNSLVDNEFDYKKHTVKDLAHHFAMVKPKAELPFAILPEQRLQNGQQGPALNYLGGKQDFAAQQQVFTKKEVSSEEVEASKKAYELKKKQQMEQKMSSSSSSTTTTSSSTITMREKKTEEVKKVETDHRRSSVSSALLMDPAAAHAQAGIIDPSAILRGEKMTPWAPSSTLPWTLPVHNTTTKTFQSESGPRSYVPFNKPSQPPAILHPNQFPPDPPVQTSCPTISESAERTTPPAKHFKPDSVDSKPVIQTPSLSPNPGQEYQATVQTSSKQFSNCPPTNQGHANLETTRPNIQTINPTHQGLTNTSLEQSVIQKMLRGTLGPVCDSPTGAGEEGLVFPDTPRSTAATPAPTVPFPPVDSQHSTTLFASSVTQSECIRIIPPSPVPSLGRRTPILVTTRPSSTSLDHRARHVSKDDLARMMAELNAPLPPMVEIPDEIRASPLIFHHGGLAAVSLPHQTTKAPPNQTSTSSLATTSTCSLPSAH